MSVHRNITIRLLTNKELFSDLFMEFAVDFWFNNDEFMVSSLEKDDIDEFEFYDYLSFEALKPILDYREKKGYNNYLNIKVENEEISIISEIKHEKYNGFLSHYEVSLVLGIAKRIDKAERYTDFGYYLNKIVPRFLEIGCYICEIRCSDYDC